MKIAVQASVKNEWEEAVLEGAKEGLWIHTQSFFLMMMTMSSAAIFIIWPHVKEFTPLRLLLEFKGINQSCYPYFNVT